MHLLIQRPPPLATKTRVGGNRAMGQPARIRRRDTTRAIYAWYHSHAADASAARIAQTQQALYCC